MTKRSYSRFVSRLTEIGLRDRIEARALKTHVTLQELYEGHDHAPSITVARRAVYVWLGKEGKGYNEIGRLFDRAPSGVWKLMRGRDK